LYTGAQVRVLPGNSACRSSRRAERGEEVLSAWMTDNAFVTWSQTPEPWLWEERAIETLDLPLNLSGNSSHRFHGVLAAARALAKAQLAR
jgi:hypothetical protein